MNDEIYQLVARFKIIETIDDLFVATDNRDWEKVSACLAEAVLFDMRSMTGEAAAMRGAREIINGWEQGLRPIKAVHHQAGNYRITVAGAEAQAFCYGLALHYLPNPSGNTRVFVGSYDFHLKKSDERWRIDKFRFNLKFIAGNAELEDSQ